MNCSAAALFQGWGTGQNWCGDNGWFGDNDWCGDKDWFGDNDCVVWWWPLPASQPAPERITHPRNDVEERRLYPCKAQCFAPEQIELSLVRVGCVYTT